MPVFPTVFLKPHLWVLLAGKASPPQTTDGVRGFCQHVMSCLCLAPKQQRSNEDKWILIDGSLPTEIEPLISTWIFRSCWLASHCRRCLGNFATDANKGLGLRDRKNRSRVESRQVPRSLANWCDWLRFVTGLKLCGFIRLSERGFKDLSGFWNYDCERRRLQGVGWWLPFYVVFSA